MAKANQMTTAKELCKSFDKLIQIVAVLGIILAHISVQYMRLYVSFSMQNVFALASLVLMKSLIRIRGLCLVADRWTFTVGKFEKFFKLKTQEENGKTNFIV